MVFHRRCEQFVYGKQCSSTRTKKYEVFIELEFGTGYHTEKWFCLKHKTNKL